MYPLLLHSKENCDYIKIAYDKDNKKIMLQSKGLEKIEY